MQDFDLYDVLADLGYGMLPRTRSDRADAFGYKNGTWLDSLPSPAAATVRAIASQFTRGGTDGLENPKVFDGCVGAGPRERECANDRSRGFGGSVFSRSVHVPHPAVRF